MKTFAALFYVVLLMMTVGVFTKSYLSYLNCGLVNCKIVVLNERGEIK